MFLTLLLQIQKEIVPLFVENVLQRSMQIHNQGKMPRQLFRKVFCGAEWQPVGLVSSREE
jgi:hypothetical protein